jgi:hypothetical protein
MFFASLEIRRPASRRVSRFVACPMLTGKAPSIDSLGIDAYAEDDLGDAPS